ncbi:hypothetical protein NKI59_28230 [Mesorhizobium sp. M0598]|uniref:phosphoribosyltransferase family protein n=1 Tax=Mesorhizobium sp. M0598 TaxID=2956968 RepID=UPI00333BDA87
MFHDRREAGQRLAIELRKLQLHQPVILALPRGGVPVAAEVAKVLKAPLDLIIVRKVGAPGNCELAVAAIVDGDPAYVVLNREVIEAYSLVCVAGPMTKLVHEFFAASLFRCAQMIIQLLDLAYHTGHSVWKSC